MSLQQASTVVFGQLIRVSVLHLLFSIWYMTFISILVWHQIPPQQPATRRSAPEQTPGRQWKHPRVLFGQAHFASSPRQTDPPEDSSGGGLWGMIDQRQSPQNSVSGQAHLYDIAAICQSVLLGRQSRDSIVEIFHIILHSFDNDSSRGCSLASKHRCAFD